MDMYASLTSYAGAHARTSNWVVGDACIRFAGMGDGKSALARAARDVHRFFIAPSASLRAQNSSRAHQKRAGAAQGLAEAGGTDSNDRNKS